MKRIVIFKVLCFLFVQHEKMDVHFLFDGDMSEDEDKKERGEVRRRWGGGGGEKLGESISVVGGKETHFALQFSLPPLAVRKLFQHCDNVSLVK